MTWHNVSQTRNEQNNSIGNHWGNSIRLLCFFLLSLFLGRIVWKNQWIATFVLFCSEFSWRLSNEDSNSLWNSSEFYSICHWMLYDLHWFSCVQGDACNDCCVVSCCGFCAALQMRSELRHHGIWNFVFIQTRLLSRRTYPFKQEIIFHFINFSFASTQWGVKRTKLD